jgi:uncharacterized integral membrane protein
MKALKVFKQILLALILIGIVVFFIQNTMPVPIRFLAMELQNIPVFLALLIFYVLGAVSGSLLFSLIKSATGSNKPKTNQKTGDTHF